MIFASEHFPMLEDLQARGLEIPDYSAATGFLRRVGEHRARIYCHPLLARSGGGESARFVSGASFPHVIALCDFDAALRLMALEALGEIEIAIRADVVRCLATRHHLAHRRREFLRDNFSGHQLWILQHDEHVRRTGKNPESPVWEAAEQWSFGMLSRLFAGMKIADRRAIAGNYGDMGGRFVANSLRVMSGVRNIAAHHERFWNNASATLLPTTPKPGKISGFNPPIDEKSKPLPCASLSVIAHFIRRIRPDEDWRGRLRVLLLKQFPSDAPGLNLAQMGFPSGWERHSFWLAPAPMEV